MDKFLEYVTNLHKPFVLEQLWIKVEIWFFEEVFSIGVLGQLLTVIAAFGLSLLAAPILKRMLQKAIDQRDWGNGLARLLRAIMPLTLPLCWLVLQWSSVVVAAAAGWPLHLIKIVVSLLTAWVVIRMATQLVRNEAWSQFIAVAAWTVAALNIVNLLNPVIRILDDAAVTVGDVRLSALIMIKAVFSLALLLWLASVVSQFMERRIHSLPSLTPSIQVLFSKLLKITLIVLAIVVALSYVGIDLTAFAVLGGAIGVGIGFGLQKIVSNLISGVILLMDRSIKPGDVISVGDTFGWINSLGARYASVITRDGTEWLIPNEDLITQQVVNWSYSDEAVRLRIPIGISYNADPRKAIALCFEAAAEEDRILKEPKSNVLLKGFGDSSVDIEMRVWIRDPQSGVSNIKSALLLRVWDKFKEHGIEIPFPQRDLHIRSTVPLTGIGDVGGLSEPPHTAAIPKGQ